MPESITTRPSDGRQRHRARTRGCARRGRAPCRVVARGSPPSDPSRRRARRRSRAPRAGRAAPARRRRARGRSAVRSARSSATSSAALDESPLPSGSVGGRRARRSRGALACSASTRVHALDVVEPAAPCASRAPSRYSRTAPPRDRRRWRRGRGRRRRSASSTRVRCGMARRQHEAVVVVGVLADQVDAAGRVGDDLGRRGRTASGTLASPASPCTPPAEAMAWR